MAPLEEKSINAGPNTSPNTSRKRKSDTSTTEKPSKSAKDNAPAAKRARKAAPSKTTTESKPTAAKEDPSSSPTPDTNSKKTTTTTNAKTSSSSSSSRAAKPDTDKYDISDITLEGESTAQVPVFDTASDIRTKINTHTRTAPKSHSSNAALIRAFEKSYPPNLLPAEGISTRSLKTYLAKKGPAGGLSHPITYAAYVYFEKLRIKQGKKKSKKREEMESSWGKGGVDLRADSDSRILMTADDRVAIDKYAHMTIVRPGPGGYTQKLY